MGKAAFSVAVAVLAATLGGPVYAAGCENRSSLSAMSPNLPAYEAYLLELTPPKDQAINWLQLQSPGLVARPRAPVDSTPAAYGSDLYVATLPVPQAPALVDQASRLGRLDIQGPLRLTAAWGVPSQYRQHKSFNYARESITTNEGAVLQLTTDVADSAVQIRVTGHAATEYLPEQIEVSLSWQQITGWATQVKTRDKGKTTYLFRTPQKVQSNITECYTLAENDAILFGGIQGLMMAPDGKSEVYRELAVMVRKLPSLPE